MRRRVLNLLTVLSLLLFVAVCALWVRSYWATDLLWWRGIRDKGDRCYFRQDVLAAGRGGVGMSRQVRSGSLHPANPGPSFREVSERVSIPFHRVQPPKYPSFYDRKGSWPGRAGFQFDRYDAWPDPNPRRPPHGWSWKVVVPCWALAAATAIFPGVWAGSRVWRLWRYRGAGRCPSCGYDLRATPDKCPECGTSATIPA
jgi:hypothetical protein